LVVLKEIYIFIKVKWARPVLTVKRITLNASRVSIGNSLITYIKA